VLVAMSPETMPRRGGVIASLRPRLDAPAARRSHPEPAGAVFVATWSLGGFYQAFGPSVAAEYLGTTSPLAAATMFSSVMILNPVGGPATARLAPRAALRLGMAMFVVALVGIVVSLHAGTFVPLVAASLAVGIAQGAASTAGVRALLAGAGQEERAGLLATIYLVGYSGAAIPGVVSGQLARTLGLFDIAVGYAVLGTVAAFIAAAAARNPAYKENTP
jgi:MFS family permease